MELHSHTKSPFLFIIILSTFTSVALSCTRVGFYETTCPRAEAIVQSVVQSAIRANQTYAPGILRMFFHDCFVNGCDASILIDGPEVEKAALQNSALRGFEVIQAAKTMLETECPGVVSCADILALAARDSVVMSGGISWAVPTGRRDGLVSRASDAANLPGSRDSMDEQINKFCNKSLSVEDLVTLVGGHTIGTAACARFNDRLYDFNHTHKFDPTIDPAFLPYLRSLCPHGGDRLKRVAIDTESVSSFDTSYYENIRNGRGVLASDSLLWHDPRTHQFVQKFVGATRTRQLTFNKKFARAMVKLSNVEVKTGNQGEIRRVCNAIN